MADPGRPRCREALLLPYIRYVTIARIAANQMSNRTDLQEHNGSSGDTTLMATPRNDGLQVIGAGLMRTGIFSLHVALERLLGGKCYHIKKVVENPHHIKFWIDACKEDLSGEEWHDFFKDYIAAVDFPQVAFYERLMEVYPNAKVVLTVRDPEKWFQSVNNTIAKVLSQLSSFPTNLISALTGKGNFVLLNQVLMVKRFNDDLTKKFGDRAAMLKAYEEHVENVKRIVPADRLLVFQSSKG